MENNIIKDGESLFDSIRHVNEYGQEYWAARELMPVLEYKQWRRFEETISRAVEACEGSKIKASDHFAKVGKMVTLGSGSQRKVDDYHLSRYACYLIAMNGDPKKEAIALAQTYFAVKTRQQELAENYDNLSEDERRIAIRAEMRKHNKSLADAARGAGVIEARDFAIFQNHGYMGLYGGLNMRDIHARKGLKKSQHILDHMGSTELGGTMPEDLPTPDKSIKQLEREQKKRLGASAQASLFED